MSVSTVADASIGSRDSHSKRNSPSSSRSMTIARSRYAMTIHVYAQHDATPSIVDRDVRTWR